MSRADDIARVAAAIEAALADGDWHKAVGLGGWGIPPGLVGDALNHLLQAEVIEEDARRRTYRLIPQHAQQLTIGETS